MEYGKMMNEARKSDMAFYQNRLSIRKNKNKTITIH